MDPGLKRSNEDVGCVIGAPGFARLFRGIDFQLGVVLHQVGLVTTDAARQPLRRTGA